MRILCFEINYVGWHKTLGRYDASYKCLLDDLKNSYGHADWKRFAHANEKIQAIKTYRLVNSTSLVEAKRIVEEFMNKHGIGLHCGACNHYLTTWPCCGQCKRHFSNGNATDGMADLYQK